VTQREGVIDVKQFVAQTARVINRRNFLTRASIVSFGTLAAMTVGRMPVALAAPCTGPFGTGDCGDCACAGRYCSRCVSGNVSCISVPQYCGGSCWKSSSGGYCCDCRCGYGGYYWYCYCYG
jgi:hypothetical protein